MNNTLVSFNNMIRTEEELTKIKENFFDKINSINTDLDVIDNYWDGKKSEETLKIIDEIKKEYADIIIKFEESIVSFNTALKNYIDATSQGVVDSSQSIGQDNVTTTSNEITENIPITQDVSVINNDTIDLSGETNNGTPLSNIEEDSSQTNKETLNLNSTIDSTILPFSQFDSQLSNYAIQSILNGENPLMSLNLNDMMINFNSSPNTTNRDSAYLQEAAKSLNNLQTQMKDNGIWGTEEANQAILFWQLKTGFRPAARGSTTTDGLGNFRYVGINSNWNKNGQGLDCTNYTLWTQTNSGNVVEGKVINRNPRKTSYNDNYSYSSSTLENYSAGDPVSYVGTNGSGHTGMYLGTQNGYAYSIEAVNSSYGGGSGPVIRIRAIDGNELPKELEKYKNSSFTTITKWKDLIGHGQIVDPKNNAAFQNQNLVINID